MALAALQWNKRAINASFEAMGFDAALRHGSELAVLLNATSTPEYHAFDEVRQREGLTAAIRWREAQFRPFEWAIRTTRGRCPRDRCQPRLG